MPQSLSSREGFCPAVRFGVEHSNADARSKLPPMKGETGERWKQLCEQAAVEQDLEKLLQLTQEINRLLNEKEERLENLRLKPDEFKQ
jgi:hypothetical protein